MKRIVAIGANPAWQKVLTFEHLRTGEVNRASDKVEFASGKGINFVRAVRNWTRADAVVVQFAGGVNGESLVQYLCGEGLPHLTVSVVAPTRCCTTCLCRASGSMTELIEPAAAPEAAAVAEALEIALREVALADALALCGTLPGTMDPGFYVSLAQAARKRGLPVLVDAWHRIETVLDTGAAILLKINAEELRALAGRETAAAGIAELYRRWPRLAGVGITDGPKLAYWGDPSGTIYGCAVPRLEEVVNPVGSGDTVSAVTMSEYLAGASGVQAFRAGLAAAQANCLNIKCADFDRAAALRFVEQVFVSELEG